MYTAIHNKKYISFYYKFCFEMLLIESGWISNNVNVASATQYSAWSELYSKHLLQLSGECKSILNVMKLCL